MTRHLLSRAALVAAIGVLVAGAPAAARSDRDHEAARAALARGEILPLTRILAVVAQQSPGDILEVELERHDSRFEYEVRVLTAAGKVVEFHLDARTGALLKDGKGNHAGADRRR